MRRILRARLQAISTCSDSVSLEGVGTVGICAEFSTALPFRRISPLKNTSIFFGGIRQATSHM